MILSSEIPLNASVFLRNIQQDYQMGRYSGDYRALLIAETRSRYPGLVEGLSDMGRGRTSRGEVRVLADADHIVPRSVWRLLIPPLWTFPGAPPSTPDILSNLFWRNVAFNRGAESRGEALDQALIRRIKLEAAAMTSPRWARQNIEIFLRTKHDEGVNIDLPMDPHKVNDMQSGVDLAEVIEFIQKTRQKTPGIKQQQLIDLIEERFPHIRIEVDSTGPRVEIG